MALKFNLGFSEKRYTHDLPYHINTTSDFGSFQPILCQYLQAGDSAKVSDFKQLIRLAAMPSPTFGEINCVNTFRFIPMSEIFPAYEALLSHQNINTGNLSYIPTKTPYVKQNFLPYCLLSSLFSDVAVYQTKVKSLERVTDATTAKTLLDSTLLTKFSSYEFPLLIFGIEREQCRLPFFHTATSDISPNAADFLLHSIDNETQEEIVLAFRLNDTGKKLYKIFKGLGYTLDLTDKTEVSFLPIFAYYKAWFDGYATTRFSNWQSTVEFKIINDCYNNNISDIASYFATEEITSPVASRLADFLTELSNSIYTYGDDWVSAHQLTPNSNIPAQSSQRMSTDKSNPLYNIEQTGASTDAEYTRGQPLIYGASTTTLTVLQALERITKFVNKNSLIGGRIAEYIKTHYGEDVCNCLYGESNHIATFNTNIQLDDTLNSSETAQIDADGNRTGDHLGHRAGVGSGFSEKNYFKYTAKNTGYVIGMMAVYPISYYNQGLDGNLTMLSRYDYPLPEFDALGYEITGRNQVYNFNGFLTNSPLIKNPTGGFGYIPRYSKYKRKTSILNGDMSLRSTFDSYSSYHLDRYVAAIFANYEEDDNGRKRLQVINNTIPDAGTSWREVLKYPQLSWFDRIFYTDSFKWSGKPGSVISYTTDRTDDNITVQCNVKLHVTNRLKPLSQSYETFDEDNDTSNRKISNV